jgi:short subunit dehydrogenase-like uncharacterized protein
VHGLAKYSIDRRLQPPNQAQRDSNPSFVWGEARNAAGKTATARVVTANGYALTIASSLGIIGRVLEIQPAPGFITPSLLMGADFVSTLPGSSQIRFDA